MIPAYWHEGLPAFLWQVTLHSLVIGAVFYGWARWVQLPSGGTRRRLLILVLVLPVLTAAVPGRASLEFRGRTAWFDSGRVLAVPLPVAGARLYHLVLAVGALTAALAFLQEVVPALRRARPAGADLPDELARFARSLPGWAECRLTGTPDTALTAATGGWPGRPTLMVSRGALDRLTEADLQLVIRHEHAHARPGRWWVTHALFLFRLAQLHNPVALWVFREFTLEEEIACDAEAAAGGRAKALGRVLLGVYRDTARLDIAARATLRKRVDVLLAGGPQDDVLPAATIGAASAVMAGVLPWLV